MVKDQPLSILYQINFPSHHCLDIETIVYILTPALTFQ